MRASCPTRRRSRWCTRPGRRAPRRCCSRSATSRAHTASGRSADEWRLSAPELFERLAAAERSAAKKGWRWVGEMEEIADTFDAAGAPDGFHRAAAEVYRVVIRAPGLAKRFGDRRVFARRRRDAAPTAASCSSPGRTARGRRRCCACSPDCSRADAGRRSSCRARHAIGYLGARAARLPRADAAREPDALRPALPHRRARRARSGCCSSASGSGTCATSVSRRSRAACSSGSGSAASAARAGAAPARRAVQRARRRRRGAARRACSTEPADDGRRDARARARRASRDRAAGVRMTYSRRRRRARAQGPAARAAREGDAARRCCCSWSRR